MDTPTNIERRSDRRWERRRAVDHAVAEMMFPGLRTSEARQDRTYATLAMRVLNGRRGRERWDWFFDHASVNTAREPSKLAILAELGRLGDEPSIVAMADEITALDPRPAWEDVVAMVRQRRLGFDPPAGAFAHADHAPLDRHTRPHPQVTAE